MTDFMIEHTSQGRILRYGLRQSGLAMLSYPLHGGQIWLKSTDSAEELYATVDPNLHFFDPVSEEILHRPKIGQDDAVSIPADGEFEARIPVVAGTIIRLSDDEFLIDDGDTEFVFSTDEPGVFAFEVEPPFPHQTFKIEVTAHEV